MRNRPKVLSLRVTARERSMVAALADTEDVTASEELHRLLIPAVRRRLAELAGDEGRDDAERER